MTNQAFIDYLTQAIPEGLPHPGNEHRPASVIPTPFKMPGANPQQEAEFIGTAARLWAEGLANLADLGGFEILTKPDAAQLREDARTAPDGTRIIKARRGNKAGPIICELTIDKTDDVALPEAILREGV